MKCTIQIEFENEYPIDNGLVPVFYSAREVTEAHVLELSSTTIGKVGNFASVANISFGPTYLTIPIYTQLIGNGVGVEMPRAAYKVAREINAFLNNNNLKGLELRLRVESLKSNQIITIKKVDK